MIDRTGRVIVEPSYRGIHPDDSGRFARVWSREYAGLIDRTGRVILPLEYQEIGQIKRGLMVVRRNDFAGIVDTAGRIVTPIRYERIRSYYGIFMLKEDQQWGITDSNGCVLVEPRYTDFRYQHGNLMQVSIGGKWGLVSTSGRIVPPRYDSTAAFTPAILRVRVNDKWGLVDTSGRVVMKPRYSFITPPGYLTPRHAQITTGGRFDRRRGAIGAKWGIIRTDGTVVVEPVFDEIGREVLAGMIRVRRKDRWGLIETTGRWVVPAQYESESPRGDHGIWLRNGTQWTLFGKDGKILHTGRYDDIMWIRGFARTTRDTLRGLIDRNGRCIFPLKLRDVSPLGHGIIAYKPDSLWGIADSTGKVLIPPRFTHVNWFVGGIARIGTGGPRSVKTVRRRLNRFPPYGHIFGDPWGFLDTTGRLAAEPRYYHVGSPVHGLVPADDGATWLDLKGNVIWPRP